MIIRELIEERKRSIQARLNQGLPEDTSDPMYAARNIHCEMAERTRAFRAPVDNLFPTGTIW